VRRIGRFNQEEEEEEEEIRTGLGRQRFCSEILKGIAAASRIFLSIMLIQVEPGYVYYI